jgi:hypothetical protein
MKGFLKAAVVSKSLLYSFVAAFRNPLFYKWLLKLFYDKTSGFLNPLNQQELSFRTLAAFSVPTWRAN